MRRLWLLLSVLFVSLPVFATAPVCLFQDNLSGPASASNSEGGNGTYIVLRGKNFGATQGGSTVTINGQAPAQYFNWDAADVTGNYETIGLQVASGTTGTGAIVVTTAGGSCQYSTATISALSISSGVTTFTYTGAQLVVGQLVWVWGLTSTPGKALAARSYTVLSAGLTSTSFEVNTPQASNVSSTSDSGTAGNGGFTVTSGNIYFVGSATDNSTPGTCAVMKAANSYIVPWGMTNVANYDLFPNLALATAGTGYTVASSVPTTGGTGSGWLINITAVNGSGAITGWNITDVSSGSSYLVGDTLTASQSGGSGATFTVIGYNEELYTQATKRTPQTYYACMSAGDTLVFLNGVDFAYGDGTNNHTSLALNAVAGTSGNPITFVARPGATVTLGGEDTVNYGVRGGSVGYLNFYGINWWGSQLNGSAMTISSASTVTPANMRAVGNVAQCPDCGASAAVIFGGLNAGIETQTFLTNMVIDGNWAPV